MSVALVWWFPCQLELFNTQRRNLGCPGRGMLSIIVTFGNTYSPDTSRVLVASQSMISLVIEADSAVVMRASSKEIAHVPSADAH